jgi:hypothetical protein
MAFVFLSKLATEATMYFLIYFSALSWPIRAKPRFQSIVAPKFHYLKITVLYAVNKPLLCAISYNVRLPRASQVNMFYKAFEVYHVLQCDALW